MHQVSCLFHFLSRDLSLYIFFLKPYAYLFGPKVALARAIVLLVLSENLSFVSIQRMCSVKLSGSGPVCIRENGVQVKKLNLKQYSLFFDGALLVGHLFPNKLGILFNMSHM